MCIGRNYADHIKELSSATPKQPFFFLKPPSSILLPGTGPVLRPKGVNMHFEVELGLIMGKTLRDLHPEDTKGAMDAIEGRQIILPLRASICAKHTCQYQPSHRTYKRYSND
jgi:acylpyruvate hydrolase